MMRTAFAILLISTAVSLPVHAGGKALKFDGVQERCVQTDKVKFGANQRWAECTVTKGRWFVTLDFIDMYQAQYCLGKGDGSCDQRAFMIFSNRAYKPDAHLMMQRLDPGAAEYEEPQVVQTKYGTIMTLSARYPDGRESRNYYRWESERWSAVDASRWLRELTKKLPKGETVTADVWPDADSMHAQAKLAASGKVADIELGIVNDRFTVRKVTLAQNAD
jgi:hypothetical protein